MPLHPKATEFAKSGLFAGLFSFEELEKRIAAIPENKGKGDAFEVFAEAYLTTQRKHDAKQVWPLSATPLDLLGKLGLGGMDYGVDGILQTLLGDLSAYQVKFRTAREPMTWRELSTFMGLADSPHIRSRILITNCDELPPVINDRQGFFCIRGSDLDRMDVSDFQAIEAWLAEAAIQAPKKKPLPHQEEALAAIVPTLQKESRATAIMACGTGKTLVTLWTMEQLAAQKVLVLLPSLALLRQTLHEWLKETSLDLAYLCVCSDPSVKSDADEIATPQSDLDFEVSTDSATVRRFLDAPFEGTKIVLSTYQSASVVGEAINPDESFDLGIFDEAHKTAGREGRNYGYALEDRNIPITKRLFVTATPRHYNPSKRNKEGEATVAFSMDDPQVYGEQCYSLSFSEAANLGIICGYNVIISVITSDQVNDEILSRGIVEVKGDEVRARQVANQIALRDAVAQYGVGKVFTFHSTVKSAASFVAHGNEGIRTHLPEFDAFHVSGAMPTARRERVMKKFRAAPRAVMSNARCLTEGVDVPAVDMVAFLSPKKSKVDIVQAIGRAMRKSPGKEIGYVLVPLYLEQKDGETLEEAVARTNFEEVWDILQSLKEQDEVLADLIRDMAEAKGRGKGEKENPLGDRIDFVGPVLSLESLRDSITARTLERLESSWDINFGKLQKFKEEHGHSRVSQLSKDHELLGSWVSSQRSLYAKGILSADRIKKLESVGFDWDVFYAEWERLYNELKQYRHNHGDSRVPKRSPIYSELGQWVSVQRRNYSKGKLSIDRIAKLLDLDFDWDPISSDWEIYFKELEIYKSEHGDCRVPNCYDSNRPLAAWVKNQRQNYRKGILTAERIAKLEKLGFEWEVTTARWDELFDDLIKYKEETGDYKVPTIYKPNQELAYWVTVQRRSYKNGTLSKDKITRLKEIGFTLDVYNEVWEIRFNDLLSYKDKYGDCRVPNSFKENKMLGVWVANQRSLNSKRKLSAERIALLDSVGFIWYTYSQDLEKWIKELILYKSKHGDCRVPYAYKPNRPLSSWVNNLRQRYSKGKLTSDILQRLEEIGFEWKLTSTDWEKHFEDLKCYFNKYGNCRPPADCVEFNRVGAWCGNQKWITNPLLKIPIRIPTLDTLMSYVQENTIITHATLAMCIVHAKCIV
jgi:superfamily II DNA or RNA helicase